MFSHYCQHSLQCAILGLLVSESPRVLDENADSSFRELHLTCSPAGNQGQRSRVNLLNCIFSSVSSRIRRSWDINKHYVIPWRRKWQPTPVFLPGKFHGQRSLMGYSPCGHKLVRHDWAHSTHAWKNHERNLDGRCLQRAESWWVVSFHVALELRMAFSCLHYWTHTQNKDIWRQADMAPFVT